MQANRWSKGNIQSALRKYKSLLTTTVALVLFGTFIIKDLKREELKNTMDSVHSAQNIFYIRRSIVKPTGYDKSFYIKGTQDGLNEVNEQLGNWIWQLAGTLDNISELTAAIPHSADDGQLKQIQSLRQKHDQLSQLHLKVARMIDDIPPDAPAIPSMGSTAGLVQKGLAVEGYEIHTLDDNLTSLSDSVIARAKQIENSEKSSYDTFTKISVFMYSVGSFMGLMGQLIGLVVSEEVG